MELNSINYIKSGEQLDKFLRFEEEFDLYFLFKYSPLCMTSYMIEKNFDAWIENQDSSKLSIYKINVVSDRVVSQKVEEKLRIAHQSPQLIILNSDGEVVWHGSHGKINEKKLDEILKTRPQDAV